MLWLHFYREKTKLWSVIRCHCTPFHIKHRVIGTLFYSPILKWKIMDNMGKNFRNIYKIGNACADRYINWLIYYIIYEKRFLLFTLIHVSREKWWIWKMLDLIAQKAMKKHSSKQVFQCMYFMHFITVHFFYF